jgi:hypothetical protein
MPVEEEEDKSLSISRKGWKPGFHLATGLCDRISAFNQHFVVHKQQQQYEVVHQTHK